MYYGLLAAGALITVFFAVKAAVGHFWPGAECFNLKSCICFIVGAILGGIASSPLWDVNMKFAVVVQVLVIVLVYILVYSGIAKVLINKIPENIRKGFKIAFKIIMVILIVVAIVGAVWLVLTFFGV